MGNISNLVAYGFAEFIPLNPFYTNILKDIKKFSLSEVSNLILPFFFYISFIGLFVCLITHHLLKSVYMPLSVYLLQISVFIITVITPCRSFTGARILYSIAGIIAAYKSMLRILSVSKSKSVSVSQANIKLIRFFSASISAWIGQGVFMCTGHYNINIALSIMGTLIAAILSFIDIVQNGNPDKMGKNSGENLPFFQPLLEDLTPKLIICMLCGCLNGIMQMYMSIFAQALFYEKTHTENTSSFILHRPIMWLSGVIVKILSYFKIFRPVENNASSIHEKNISDGKDINTGKNLSNGKSINGEEDKSTRKDINTSEDISGEKSISGEKDKCDVNINTENNKLGNKAENNNLGNKIKNKSLKSGYIEGTVRISAGLTNILILKLIRRYNINIYLGHVIILFGISCTFFTIQNYCSSMQMAKLLYFFTLSCNILTENLAKTPTFKTKNPELINIISLIFASIVHMTINYMCRLKNYSSSKKASFYSMTSFVGLAIAISLWMYQAY